MFIKTTHVNATEKYLISTEPLCEVTGTKQEIFKRFTKMCGRCTGKIYVNIEGKTYGVGWVFQKKDKYEDSPDLYTLETWVSLHDALYEVSTKIFYHNAPEQIISVLEREGP